MKNLELYVHIPFCVRKCKYCDFLSGPAEAEVQEQYLEMLLKEIDEYKALLNQRTISTLFFGGGTPSILDGNAIL